MTHQTADTDDGPEVTRRQFNAGLVGLGAASTTALSFGSNAPDALTPAALELLQADQSRFRRSDIDLQQKTYGGGQPSWAVHYEDGNAQALADWVAAEDDGTLVRNNADWGVATVALPSDRVHEVGFTSFDDSGLASLDYVTLVAPDLLVEVEPKPLESSEVWESEPDYNVAKQVLSGAPASINNDGVAFDEVDTHTLEQARTVTNDDTVGTEGGPDPLAIIDSGVNHGELRLFTKTDADGNTVTRILDASKDFVDANETTVGEGGLDVIADPNGHGTWVAADAAANPSDTTYHGFASAADLLALRVLNGEGKGSTATIAAAVRYAADQGASVACMSLGSPIFNEDLELALKYATDNGLIPVVAAGNSRLTERFLSYPAASEYTIAVGSTTVQAPPDTRSSYFSNVEPSPGTDDFSNGKTAGVELDLAATGHKKEAKVATETNTVTTRVLSGTSMAAPDVAGAAHVLTGVDSSLDGDLEAMRERLRTTAQPVEQLAAAEVGDGLLDVQAAVDNTPPDEEQADVMTNSAASRNAAYRAEADARGGWIGNL